MKAKQLCFARVSLAILLGGFAAGWNTMEPRANAQVSFTAGLAIHSPADFYGPLSSYGSWMDVGRYGRCWHPAHLLAGWRPYTVGHWEWTDCGWYWVSDEPWSWAAYHYGYWTLDPTYGWIWVPGTEWAPAWVVWRESPDYIGWAPCGPGGAVFSDSFFVFADIRHFHDRFGPQDRELVFNNPGIFRRTQLVGGFRNETRDFDGVRRRIAFNPGPSIDPIQRATGTRFTRRPVTELARQTAVPASVRGKTQPSRERAPSTQQPAVSRAGREEQRLYHEPATMPAVPTGRQEQRIYHEVPTPQPAPQPSRPPAQLDPRRQSVPEVSRPPAVTPERPLPPAGRDNGRIAPQESAPHAAPAPAPRPAPAQPLQERDRQRGDGQ